MLKSQLPETHLLESNSTQLSIPILQTFLSSSAINQTTTQKTPRTQLFIIFLKKGIRIQKLERIILSISPKPFQIKMIKREITMLSSSSSSTSPPTDNDGLHLQERALCASCISSSSVPDFTRSTAEIVVIEEEEEELGEERNPKKRREREEEEEEGDQLSFLTVLVTVFRKSLVSCNNNIEDHLSSSSSSSTSVSAMEISWPSNVRHVAHVTFDRFAGFLGLPVEFEPEVPRRPPSASTRVFGVSTECMQLSFDSRGNCVPTILLMMQRRLYEHGGLQAEGIFRITAENGQEELVREQLNNGVVPHDIDVHCLAGLIKAWFRELPRGILDSLSPEEVMGSQSEEECVGLVSLLPPTEAALLDWAINLMADVAESKDHNKMNARNVAVVFAPNMTQMADPLTALMHAVQVMNFLKILIERTLRNREESSIDANPEQESNTTDETDEEQNVGDEEATTGAFLSSIENIPPEGNADDIDDLPGRKLNKQPDETSSGEHKGGNGTITSVRRVQQKHRRMKNVKLGSSDHKKASKRICDRQSGKNAEDNNNGLSIRGRNLNSRTERVKAWV
ncbi:unnamed protein product [Cuscuta epithymum]|uniref:Uncharacterized protein n=1 Tax=Cuscuta epithymum TaxID=186058 RepID=A0AAV0CBJ7_9ASTE|nr:unnamed protein product [Cuscuta epithymum]